MNSKLRGNESSRLSAPTRSDKPYRDPGLVFEPHDHGLYISNVFRSLSKTAQKWCALAVGGHVNDRHRQPTVREQLPCANKKITVPPI